MRLIGRPWLYCGLAIIAFLTAVAPVIAGQLPGNDDIMRAVQVRDLAAGDQWFAVDQPRYISPEQGDIHWSRLPDLGVLAVYSVARVVLADDMALFVAAAFWPMVLFCGLIYATSVAARRLEIGVIGQAIAMLGIVHSQALSQFQPGRIDHHGLILLLAMTAFAAILSSGRRSAVLAGLVVAAMISVALESLPVAAALVLSLGLMWIVDGARQASRLVAFGAALSFGSLAAYLFDAPGPGAVRAVCDAFGQGHFVATAFGGLGFASLGLVPLLNNGRWPVRLGAGVAAGALTLIAFGIAAPACLGSPYAGLPDVVAEHWLSQVTEARSMWADYMVNGPEVIARHAFPILALVAGAIWAYRSPPGAQVKRSVLMLVLAVSCLATVWQIRSGPMAHIFGVLIAGAITGPLFDAYRTERNVEALAMASVLVMALSPFMWRTAGEAIHKQKLDAQETPSTPADCRSAEAFAALAEGHALRVLAPIDLGAPLLLHTSHKIYAAPYHRNAEGIALALDIFSATPADARVQLSALGADAVAFCTGMNEAKLYAKLGAEGLGVKLNTGEVPDWLEAVAVSESAVQLYRVRDDSDNSTNPLTLTPASRH